MYIRPEQIVEQYEMEVKSISKGRDCFLCEADLGMRALKEYRGSKERAEFLAGMLQFLKEQRKGNPLRRTRKNRIICCCLHSAGRSVIPKAGRTWSMR